jgi:hypothetical protein
MATDRFVLDGGLILPSVSDADVLDESAPGCVAFFAAQAGCRNREQFRFAPASLHSSAIFLSLAGTHRQGKWAHFSFSGAVKTSSDLELNK